LPIPDDVPDEKALYLSDVIPTSYHGTELAQVKEGDIVGIWGLGPIGLMTARWCFIRKAAKVIGMETVPERIELAKKLGVIVVDFSKEKVLDKIKEIAPGGLDCAIECAGFEYPKSLLHKVEIALSMETDTADILTECIMATKKCGIVSIIGVYSGFTNHFPIGALMEKGITINGGQSPTQKYWRMALEKIQSGELDPTFILTHRGSLSDAPELYKKFHKRDDGIIKVFLRPSDR
jgi:threonine dehydrogenase-like Zn-dependent dehydrogenase